VQWRKRAGGRLTALVWMTGPLALVLVSLVVTSAAMWPAASAAPTATTFALGEPMTVTMTGTAAVGALFSTSGGVLGKHFCTASVVDSPAGDLLVTAAHCVRGYSDAEPDDLAFVPGYDDGVAPYGIWTVTAIFVDSAWASSANPNDDVAFLTVANSDSGTPIEDVTGGERLGIDQPSTEIVRVTGYPDTQNAPITCENQTTAFSFTQLQFDCDDYTDGTSGGPFVVEGATAAQGMVIGVIGGYQQGGDLPDISYAATFGANVAALYRTATGQS
jgi:V8-like Glu-specific endopeptidase